MKEKEENWGLFSFSQFFWACAFDTWLWWVDNSAGSVDFSLSLVLQRVPNQLLRSAGSILGICCGVLQEGDLQSSLQCGHAWKHWRNGISKRTSVWLAVSGSSELKSWSEPRAEMLTMGLALTCAKSSSAFLPGCFGHLVCQDSIPEEGGEIKGLQRGFSPSLLCLSCPGSDTRELLHHSAALHP